MPSSLTSSTSGCPEAQCTALVCEEMLRRTAILCDETTDFQRIVSVKVAEWHGTWSYSFTEGSQQRFCSACSARVGGRECARGPCGPSSPPLPLAGFPHVAEMEEVLWRQRQFESQEMQLIQRVQRASRAIRDTVSLV